MRGRGPPLKLIVITGMPGAGKSVAVGVARKLGVPVFSMGDRVRQVVTSRGLPLSPGVVGRIASEERRDKGATVWAKRTLAVIAPNTRVGVIDGARSAAEVDYFRGHTKGDVVVLAIHSSPATRAARVRARQRSDDKRSARGFEERDRRELGWGIGQAIALADRIIINEGSLDDYRRQVARVLSALVGRANPGPRARGSPARRPGERPARGKASTRHS